MSTWVAALAWIDEQQRFSDECLFIRTSDLVEIAVDEGVHLVLNFYPHSKQPTQLDRYRQSLANLGRLVGHDTAGMY